MSSTDKRFCLTLVCPDAPGIVHAVSGFLLERHCNITESMQHGDELTGTFAMRIGFETASEACERSLASDFEEIGSAFAMEFAFHDRAVKQRVLIMVSRFDHCLNDLLYRFRTGDLGIEIPAVVSNHEDARALVEAHGISFHHVPVTPDTREQSEARLLELIDTENIELVVLARYMQVLSTAVCDALRGRVINIHHSFLPGFKGARPYHQAYERGVKLIGATAHYVTPDLDEGPIIEQGVARVNHSHTPEELVAVGRTIEQNVLAKAVRLQVENRIILVGHRTIVFE